MRMKESYEPRMYNVNYNKWFVRFTRLVVFDNVVSKYRDRKINASVIAVGNDVYADQTARANAKSPFDGSITCDFERMVRSIYTLVCIH